VLPSIIISISTFFKLSILALIYCKYLDNNVYKRLIEAFDLNETEIRPSILEKTKARSTTLVKAKPRSSTSGKTKAGLEKQLNLFTG
jgi:hypothetical protein